MGSFLSPLTTKFNRGASSSTALEHVWISDLFGGKLWAKFSCFPFPSTEPVPALEIGRTGTEVGRVMIRGQIWLCVQPSYHIIKAERGRKCSSQTLMIYVREIH